MIYQLLQEKYLIVAIIIKYIHIYRRRVYINIFIYEGGVYIIEKYLFFAYIIMVIIIFEQNQVNKIVTVDKGYYFQYLNKYINLEYILSLDESTCIVYKKNGYKYLKYKKDSYYQIIKNEDLIKSREFNIIHIKYDIIYYSYFIYIKYYNISNIKDYFYSIDTITSRKLFNCRDYYKIYSFI